MRFISWMIKLLLTLGVLFSAVANSAFTPVAGPTAPLLSGTKYSTSVQLDWNTIHSCNPVTYEIQESLNSSNWSTVYTGGGNSGGSSASNLRFVFKSGQLASKTTIDGCGGIGGGPRFISLSSRNNAVYYYKIRACELGMCGKYSSVLQLGQPITIVAPSSINVPNGTVNTDFLVGWGSVAGASQYTLQEQIDGGSWANKYSGTSTGIGLTPSRSGSYKYRVKACDSSICSNWRTSSTVTVVLPPAAPSTINVPATDTNGNFAISWSAISGATYTLYESKNSASWSVIKSGSTHLNLTVSGRGNGNYRYLVKACKSGLCSAGKVSGTVVVLHPPQTTPVIVPESVSVTGVYDVSWKKPTTATYYNLQEKVGSGNWGSIGGNISALIYHFTGKESGSIGYRVRACNTSGCSTWSAARYVTVLHIPSTPTSITVPTSTVTNGTISVGWSATGNAATYTLQESKNSGSWATINSAVTGTNYSRTGRTNGSYRYRVRACNSSGCGGYRTSGSVSVHLPPATPSSIAVPNTTSTNGTIAISWAAASTTTKYTLQELKSGGSWTTVSSALTSTSYSRTGRSTGAYTFRIRACNSSGCSGYRTSNATYVVKTPSSLTVPSNDADGAYTVSWAAVSGATSYQLEQKVGSGSWTSIYSGTGRTKSLSGLGTNKYQYRVKAKYGSISGSYRTSAVTYVVKTPSSISVPSNDDDGAYSISWAAVSGATGYQLEQKVGSGSWTSIYSGTGRSKSLSGLGTNTYQYRVKAKFGSVSGSYRASNATYVVKTPSSLTVPSNDADGAYSVSWAAVSGATSYQLEQKVGSGSWTSIYSGTGRSKAVSGLATNSYQYRVKAKYGSVSGSYRASNATYVVKTPSSLTVPSNDADGAYSVSWAAVSGATGYQLEQKVGSGSWVSIYTGSSFSKSVSGQTNNTYQYRVKAKYGSVSGGYRTSSVVTVLLPPPVPASITTPTSTVVNGSYTISWPATSTATSYTLAERVNGGSWSYTTISGLSKSYSGRGDASYQYAVRGCNASACGSWKYSGTFNVLNIPAMPSSITTPSTNYISSFTISWSKASTATSYTLAQSVNGASWTYETVSGTSKNYSNRSNATYRYAVRACNSSGCSNYKYSNTFTNTLSPSSIIVPTSSTTGSFTISWSQVGTATSYTLQESVNNGAWSTVASPTATNYSLTGLQSGSYRYKIRACNASGCSEWRVSSPVTVSLPPPIPASFSVPSLTNTNGMIELAWSASTTATEYTLQEKKDGDAWESITLAATNYTYTDRDNGSYIYRVRACNDSGCSGWKAALALTVLLPPKDPSSISVPNDTVTNGNITVSWASVSTAVSYSLQQNANNSTWTNLTSQEGTSFDQIVNADGSYQYRVNACNTSGCSDWKVSNAVEVILPPAWRQTKKTLVSDAESSDSVPTETVELTAAALKGKAGFSGGQASYQIPIDLPPGRNGIQPKVSLSYNSQTGNGIAGVGWSLNAGSAISRCGATHAQDGFTRAVTFNAETDRLCLNGQRLITLGSTESYGTSGTEYRTEMDSFVKVVQTGEINGASTSFTVHRPDGSQATYGSNANSRFILGGLTTTLTWKVTQESWANGNNTIGYEYDASITGEHLLSKIYYTGSSGAEGDRVVEFTYENRNDTRLSYLAGGKTVTERRLKQINTQYDSDVVSKYHITYKPSNASARSLISNVKLCDNAGDCLPITSFNWTDSTNTVQLQPLGTDGSHAYPDINNIDSIVPNGDRNGDGVRDWAGLYVNAEGEFTASNGLDLKPCEFNIYSRRLDCTEGDFNQDGLTDDWENRNGTLYLNITNGSEINTGIQLIVANKSGLKSSRIVNISDYNGDSWPDLMVFHNYAGSSNNSRLKLYLHSKNIQAPYSSAINVFEYPTSYSYDSHSYSLLNDIQFVGDMTGDGIPDLIKTDTGAGRPIPFAQPIPKSLLTGLGNGYFSSSELDFGINQDPLTPKFTYFIDINSDGLSDWLGWDERKILIARLNKGRGVFASEVTLTGDANSIESRFDHISHGVGEPDVRLVPKYEAAFKFHDIDNDGSAELLMPGSRIYEGCTLISTAFPAYSQRYRCGEELYGTFHTSNSTSSIQSINSALVDQSIYQFEALSFSTKGNGSISVTKKTTELYGHAYQSVIADAFGNGLPTMVFNHKSPAGSKFEGSAVGSPFEGFESSYGVYINRNYGSGNGLTPSDYGAVDYLESVTDGFGNQSSWRYRPLSTGEGSAGETKMYHTDHDYVGDGYINFGSSMYVVQSFEQSDGLNGTNETEYAYKGAMYNLQGRGFTGFREVIEKDVARNKTTQSVFKQKFPYVGLLESQTVKVGTATVATTVLEWADNPQHDISGVSHNINTSTVTRTYGLSGSSEQRSSVEQSINTADITEHGNIKKRTKIVTDYIDGGANSYQTVVETDFTPDTDNWFLGKFASKTTTTSVTERSWSNDPMKDRLSTQSQKIEVDEHWHPVHHKPTQVTYTASGSSCDRVEATTFNDYGLPASVTINGSKSDCGAMTARSTSFTYTKNGTSPADDGYLPYKVSNAKQHVTTTEYDMGLGVPTKVTAPNSFITVTEYDAIGRPVQLSQTGSPIKYVRYLLAARGSHAPSHAQLMTRTTAAGMPTQEVYLDSLGRSLRTATQAFDGSSYQYLDKQYDSLGQLTHESLPYMDGDTPEYTIFSGFDALGRPSSRSLPNGESGGLISNYIYTGLKTDITVEGRTMSRTYGMQGLLYETVDADDNSNRFSYGGAGRPLIIQDANNSKIVASYNGFGHKTQVVDPNQGTTTFGYNTLGELDSQTDANEVTQTFTLDTLGRIKSKSVSGSNADGSASYTWDTLKQGMLSSETQNGITRSYTYTDNLQLAASSVKVATSVGGDNATRTVSHQYDSFYGRPKALTYPNELTLEYRYNDSGYLNQTRNAASGYTYRTVTQMDAAGHVTGSQMANTLLTQTSRYNSEGTMVSTAVSSTLGLLHSHYYDRYDSFMNLKEERNGVTGLEKHYDYDSLNRLEQYSFSNAGFAIYDGATPFTATVNYGYDAVGNLLKKSDYSSNTDNAYEYNSSCATGSNAGPNAVCAITKLSGTKVSFSYDKRGNLLSGDDLTMTYNALDKPLTISGRGPGNDTVTAFVYGSDNMRALQTRTVSNKTTKTHYVDKLFEVDNDGSWRAYISDIAVLSYTPEKSHQLLFTLRDRLGSATTMVDHQGNIITQRYFDPFGRTATASVAGSLGDLLDTNRNRRGFTDHEHLNEQQLIHMNGRVYDYNMGRFMSVDPLIQSPTSTQSVNPYSYIMNNPLAATDPTGYVAEEVEKKIKVSTTGSRIKRTVTATVASNGKGGATVTFSGGNGASRNAAKNAVAGKLSGAGFSVSDIGGQNRTANQGGGGIGFASTSDERIGSIDKSLLGKESVDSQQTYDKAFSFFENDENNEGDTIHFEDKYAIAIRSSTNHGEVYKPKLFNDFKSANEYAAKKYSEGYEKVWLDGYHYGGHSYIYKTSTFSRGQLSGVERALAVMAHESRHYNKLDPSRARSHNTDREHWAFQQRSTQTIRRYRTMKSGVSK